MDVKEIENERLKRKYEIVLPFRKIAELENEKLEEVRSTAHIRGFRPGKVPMSLIKKRFGDAVRSNVLDEHSKSVLDEFMNSKDEKPVAGLNVALADREDENADYVLTVDYECRPEIPDVDLSSVEVEKLVADIDDDFVSRAIRIQMLYFPAFAEAPEGYKARKGDRVRLSYRAEAVDDSSLQESGDSLVVTIDAIEDNEESRLTAMKFDQVPPLLRSIFHDIFGMSDHLVGMKAGDTAQFELDTTNAFSDRRLAGKKAKFDIEIKSIEKCSTEFDEEELARRHDHDSAAAYRLQFTERLQRHYEKISKEMISEDLMRELSKKLEFDAPEALVDKEIDYHTQRLADAAPIDEENRPDDSDSSESEPAAPDAETGDHNETSQSESKERIRRLAERRVKHFLFLEHLAQKHQISLDSGEFLDFARKIARSETDLSSMLARCQNDAGYRQNMVDMATADKTSNFALELASVETKKIPPDDLIKIYMEKADMDHLKNELESG